MKQLNSQLINRFVYDFFVGFTYLNIILFIQLVVQYPFVSKTIRDSMKPPEERRTHTCGMTLQNEGLGYCDLDELLKNPCDLEFIFEMLSIEQPQDYQKDSWQMDDEEKFQMVKKVKEEGNEKYKEKDLKGAESCYQYAIGLLEQLMLKEKPGDTEWNEFAAVKAPLLLNYSQCKLLNKSYYEVVTHCTEAIKIDPTNPKAYYRRAKAHAATWNREEAEKDYAKCVELDPKLKNAVTKELAEFKQLLAEKEKMDKEKYKGLF